ncbi:MAG TPA: acyl-CoA dehydrogenase family protein, partial [Roseiflexaceae bacterium]|nr:acyl-CoA dehydrogenase family protein [Roseiflexaceae bacterium]
MHFGLTDEQKLIVETTRRFVDKELMPYEDEVEYADDVRPELRRQIIKKSLDNGLYAANMPEEYGGGGLDAVSLALMERELGRTSAALQYLVARP